MPRSRVLPARKEVPVRKTVLDNGLRIVTERITSVRSIAIGIWVDVGSRNEESHEAGLSHLIEHMHFKGTRTRSAHAIAESIEQYGGALNAFTTREQTCYYARILDEHLPQTVDVLSDMLMESTFTPTNLGREKKVVLEEIKETEDSPSELVHDLFAESFWGKNHSLGKPILGNSKQIAEMPRKTILNFIKKHYTAPRTVIAASGNFHHDELVEIAEKRFSFSSSPTSPMLQADPPAKSHLDFTKKKIAQNHFILGFPSMSFSDKRKFPSLALNFYLGGGMSSVLFQEIREKRGLAYSVYSFQDFYRDTGMFGFYLSTDGKSLPLALDLIRKALRQLKKKPLSTDTMEKLKAQIKGSLTFSMESATGRMNRLARHELMLGGYTTLKTSFARIEAMTADDILEAARFIFDEDRMTGLSLGPVTKKDLTGIHIGS